MNATRRTLTAVLASATMVVISTHADAERAPIEMDHIFPLPNVPGYPAEEMIQNVGGEFPDARALVSFKPDGDRTSVALSVTDAPANMFFTVWLKLDAPSPLTGLGVTALASPSEIDGLGALTPESALTDTARALGITGDDGSGGVGVANGFFTDVNGDALFQITLDFALEPGGFYPFDDYDDSLAPVRFGDTPFTLRLASHATDQVGHGLVAGKHEMWFDTTTIPAPGAGALLVGAGLLAGRRRR